MEKVPLVLLKYSFPRAKIFGPIRWVEIQDSTITQQNTFLFFTLGIFIF